MIGWMMPFDSIDARQFVQPASSMWPRGWKRVGREPIDVDFERRAARRLGCVGNQRAQSFAEGGAFVHGRLTMLDAG